MQKDILDRSDLELLIDQFYKRVLSNPEISFFFTEVVELDWETHLPRIVDFWESNLLGRGPYKGNPMHVHIDLNKRSKLEHNHFEVWLQLWEESIQANFDGPMAELAIKRAKQIAQLMQLKLQSPPSL